MVLLYSLAGNESKAFDSAITVGIAVDSIDSAMSLLKKHNISIARGPLSPNPSIQFLFITDPDGYEVQLVEMRG